MSEQILNLLIELKRQWGELYVISQANTETIAEMQAHIDEMAAHATRVMNLAIVCGSIAFCLSVFAASLMIYRRIYKDG